MEDENKNITKISDGLDQWSIDEHMKLLKGEVDRDDLSRGNALQLPQWFNEEKFRRGQRFFKDNFFSLFVSKLCGVIIILTVPEISAILTMTKKSIDPKSAFKRYLATLAHMLLWYKGSIHDSSDWAFKSLKDVHQMHTAANNQGQKERSGQISQSSLALTQFGFMGFAVVAADKLGVFIKSEEDLEGYIHFWRTIGYMVGVQDRYNICRDSVAETRALCQRILEDLLNPVLRNPTPAFESLSVPLLQGMWGLIPNLNVEAFMSFTKNAAGVEVKPCPGWYSRLMYNVQLFVHEKLLSSRWFGAMWRGFFNYHIQFTLNLTMKLPLIAHFSFGTPLKNMEVKY